MTDLLPANQPFYWSFLFFHRLHEQGVRHVVISPGSRSTPLTLAAAAHQQLHEHVILDERSAAFTALGIGKATGTSAALICTSGTALANYYPAVIEARQSGIPMILTTADRPPSRRATGANQAIDQLKLFGNYPVFFHEMGEPQLHDQDLRRLRLIADQAITAAAELRGPVHLNFPFRKPLEPTKEFLQQMRDSTGKSAPANSPSNSEEYLMPDGMQQKISQANRPLIIIGPIAPKDDVQSVSRLAEKLHIPVLSETAIPTSVRIRRFSGFLRSPDCRRDLQPDLVLRFGFQPTTKALEQALHEWEETEQIYFASTNDWHDATFSGAQRIAWMGRTLQETQATNARYEKWLNVWKKAEQQYDSYFNHHLSNVQQLTDGQIYHQLTPQIPDNSIVAVSNSFPARDIHLFGKQAGDLPLFLNRGVSGIDGVTSTAVGLGLALNRPAVLFTGDLAFLHDSNALLNKNLLGRPLAIVVINNSGGSIFRMLPVKQHEKYFDTFFETPQSVDIQQLAGAHELPYHRITDPAALKDFSLFSWMDRHQGMSVIECQTDAAASMSLRKQLWDY